MLLEPLGTLKVPIKFLNKVKNAKATFREYHCGNLKRLYIYKVRFLTTVEHYNYPKILFKIQSPGTLIQVHKNESRK